MKLKKSMAALALVGLMGAVAPAHAYLSVDGWKIDFGALGDLSGIGQDNFTGYGVLGAAGVPAGSAGINTMTFNALNSTSGTFSGPFIPGGGNLPAVGDKFNVDLAGVATSVIGNTGVIPVTSAGRVLNFDVELTFVATTTGQITSVSGLSSTSKHLLAGSGPDGFAANGILEIYADALTLGNNTGVQGNTSTTTGGAGMNDGTLIATFEIRYAGEASGSFNEGALDGQDDATWVLLSNPYGIILDQDLVALLPGATLAFTNSNTDADDNNNGVLDTAPTGGLFAGKCGLPQTFATNCGVEDGSFNLAAVPEPGSLALLGLGLVGLARSRRRSA